MPEPKTFFVGLLEFFSILLPGALLTYLLQCDLGPEFSVPNNCAALAGNERIAVFVFFSYLVGHIGFLIGAWWLDEFYDWGRGHTRNAVVADVARRGHIAPWIGRALVWLVFKREENAAVERAGAIKRQLSGPVQGSGAINTFEWAKAWLTAESPASLEQVQRLEADSKFFRSLVVVLPVLILVWSLEHQGTLVVVAACLLPLALWRYMDQRLKSTNQAYWSVITLVAREDKVVIPAMSISGGVTHAGGVVFRRLWGKKQYLLVEASANPKEWVLPKGHVGAGQTAEAAAVREVQEETGMWARIVGDLGIVQWPKGAEKQTIHFYLMQRLGRGLGRDRDRRHCWVGLNEVDRASYTETRDLIRRAEITRNATEGAAGQ